MPTFPLLVNVLELLLPALFTSAETVHKAELKQYDGLNRLREGPKTTRLAGRVIPMVQAGAGLSQRSRGRGGGEPGPLPWNL